MTPNNQLTTEESARFEELQSVVRSGLNGFVEVGRALLEISDRRLYRAKYSTFDEYVRAEWNMSASHAYRLCASAEIVKGLPEKSHQLVTNESQVRELAKIPESRRAEVIEKAAAKGKVTAQSIREAAKPEPQPEPEKPHVQSAPIEILTDDAKWKNAFGGEVPKNEVKPEHPLIEVLRCEIENLSQLIDDVKSETVDCAELAEIVAHRKQLDKALKAYQKEKC